MSKTLLTLAALLLAPLFLQAQNDAKPLKVKFGKLSDEEIKMTKYDKDPDAPAVILFDKGESDYKYGLTRHIRIKIFNKSAYEHANIQIVYDKDTYVKDLKGVCYNVENGQVVQTKLTKENMFEENITKELIVKKLTMPAVREGSIIEYEYTIDGAMAFEARPLAASCAYARNIFSPPLRCKTSLRATWLSTALWPICPTRWPSI